MRRVDFADVWILIRHQAISLSPECVVRQAQAAPLLLRATSDKRRRPAFDRCDSVAGSQVDLTSSRKSLRGDGSRRMVRRWERLATLLQILGVGGERFLDPSANLRTADTDRDHTREIGEVSTPTAVIRLFVDHDVFAHLSSSSPLARRMLPSVPTGTVSLSLPATTIRSSRSG